MLGQLADNNNNNNNNNDDDDGEYAGDYDDDDVQKWHLFGCYNIANTLIWIKSILECYHHLMAMLIMARLLFDKIVQFRAVSRAEPKIERFVVQWKVSFLIVPQQKLLWIKKGI